MVVEGKKQIFRITSLPLPTPTSLPLAQTHGNCISITFFFCPVASNHVIVWEKAAPFRCLHPGELLLQRLWQLAERNALLSLHILSGRWRGGRGETNKKNNDEKEKPEKLVSRLDHAHQVSLHLLGCTSLVCKNHPAQDTPIPCSKAHSGGKWQNTSNTLPRAERRKMGSSPSSAHKKQVWGAVWQPRVRQWKQ